MNKKEVLSVITGLLILYNFPYLYFCITFIYIIFNIYKNINVNFEAKTNVLELISNKKGEKIDKESRQVEYKNKLIKDINKNLSNNIFDGNLEDENDYDLSRSIHVYSSNTNDYSLINKICSGNIETEKENEIFEKICSGEYTIENGKILDKNGERITL